MAARRSVDPPEHALPPVRHPEAPAPGERLGSHYRRCFGCGPDHPTGLHLELTAGEGCSIHAELVVGEHHQGAPGLAHGGLLAAAFDEALGTVTWLLRVPVVTAHLETDYRRPVPIGSTLVLAAECYAVAGRKIYSRAVGRLGAVDGPVAVEARAVFIAVPLEHFRANGRTSDIESFVASSDLETTKHAFEVNP
ncbi:MAG: PaaI family thioesterase [Actinomycetota bacterium]|nr:PaaI family thioesterase [Actinomycetota bacterium]MDH4352408.1 PaaI family thioesterase [Actinomycetota bacterium]MDH5277530.1 PaaI family thioesterase [Actinomycetota bacterium]